jgi:hypothetical protein
MQLQPELTGNRAVDEAIEKLCVQLRPLLDKIHLHNGTPNGAVVGQLGDISLDLGGGAGTAFWVKEAGVGTNLGWVAK